MAKSRSSVKEHFEVNRLLGVSRVKSVDEVYLRWSLVAAGSDRDGLQGLFGVPVLVAGTTSLIGL
jgi:hypothetical protein